MAPCTVKQFLAELLCGDERAAYHSTPIITIQLSLIVEQPGDTHT